MRRQARCEIPEARVDLDTHIEDVVAHIEMDNLKDVTLVTRSAVQFLARVEETGIRIDNCPAYVRRWIIAQKSLHEPDK